jgi:O-acetylserine/cysteine efflux transporter
MVGTAATMSHHLSFRDLLITLSIVAIWGFSFVVAKLALRDVPPFVLAALRFFFAAVPLVFFIPRPRIPWTYVVAYGLVMGVGSFGLLFLGLKLGMDAGLSSLVTQLQVFFTIGLAIVFLGDRPAAEYAVGAAIAVVGVALLAVHQLIAGAGTTLIGFLCVIGSSMAWASANVIAKALGRAYVPDMFALVVWSGLAAPLPLAVLSWFFEGGTGAVDALAHAGILSWACVLFLAWVATLFGFATYAKLLHRYPTALVAPFGLLIPVSGLVSGWLLLGESLAPLQMVGTGFVLAGLIVHVYSSRLRTLLTRARSD